MIEANGGLTVTLWPAYWPHQKCCSDQAPLWGLTRPRKPTGWNFNTYTKNICRRSSVIKIYFRSVVCRIKVIIFFTVWGYFARRMPEKQFWSWWIFSSDQGWVPTETQDMFWSRARNSFASEVVSAQQSSKQTTGQLIIGLALGHDKYPSAQVEQYTEILNSAPSRVGRPRLDVHNIIYWFKNTRAALRRAESRQMREAGAMPRLFSASEMIRWILAWSDHDRNDHVI